MLAVTVSFHGSCHAILRVYGDDAIIFPSTHELEYCKLIHVMIDHCAGAITTFNDTPHMAAKGNSDHTKQKYHEPVNEHVTNNGVTIKDGKLRSMPYLPADITKLKAKYRRESKLADVEDTIEYFDKQAKEDHDFFFKIGLDDEDRVRNMYWVDDAAGRVYKHYRDCILFDATYLTNMYKMPCAPFIRINNHNQYLQLGCGLVRNEDSDGYT
ncbi:Protein FAR1-RELATED SEQUENCE 5 [Hordeum vulgare]|nr:Protein FAR1-RELATED SEQUENCE 5 [Hordeum vulgare]